MMNPKQNEISVVIPAYNEETRIVDSLEKIIEYLSDRFDKFEILVVDDGSSDQTVKVVNDFSHPGLCCLRNLRNFGKGYSVRRGMLAAKYDPVLFSDADLSTPISETETLLSEIQNGKDVVIASRRLSKNQQVERSALRKLIGWGFALFVRIIILGGFKDTQCGFKMFRSSATKVLFNLQRIDRWGFDVELLYIAKKKGMKIAEVPVPWYQSEGTRLHWFTPFTMLWEVLRIRYYSLFGKY